MNPKRFYGDLWETKQQAGFRPPVQRDWLHRYILDPFFDPYANSRHELAVAMLPGGQRLLDIGCWDGVLLDKFHQTGKYTELHGVDITSEGVEATRSKGYLSQVVDLDEAPLPYQDQFFDGITMLAVLEHVFDPFSVIKEVHRVLKPGREFVIDVPNVASFSNRARILLGRLPVTSRDPGWDGGHLHYFTKHALDHFLQEQGFEILARKTTGGRPRLREWWISLLSGEMLYLCRRQP